jgi:hypothetical protein
MYFSDHNPPHFHAEYQGYSAEYSIKTLEIIARIISNRANALILEWASNQRDELIYNWEKAQIPSKMNKIEPLK